MREGERERSGGEKDHVFVSESKGHEKKKLSHIDSLQSDRTVNTS